MSKQKTLKSSFSFEGKGLHTGLDIILTFVPSPENHGIKIKRVDLPEQTIIEALADGTILGAQTGVANSIKTAGQAWQGYPAIPVGNFRRSTVVYKNLADLQKTIYDLQRKVTELETKLK